MSIFKQQFKRFVVKVTPYFHTNPLCVNIFVDNPCFDVLVSPVCKVAGPSVVGVARYEDARILCEVEAHPQPTAYRWVFNSSGASGEVPQERYTVEGTHSLLNYKPFTETDYGTLACLASNEVGQQRIPCVINVIPAGMKYFTLYFKVVET